MSLFIGGVLQKTLDIGGSAINRLYINTVLVWERFIVADNVISKVSNGLDPFFGALHTFDTDGVMTVNVALDANGSWGLPSITSAANDYEIQADQISGSNSTFWVNGINVGFGAYFDMTGGAEIQKNTGTLIDTVRIRIREKVGGAVVFDTASTGHFTLDR